MPEYIEREALLKKLSSISVTITGGRLGNKMLLAKAYKAYAETILKDISEAPAADVVEIKDCTQCEHFTKHAGQYPCSHCRNCYTDKFKPKEGV